MSTWRHNRMLVAAICAVAVLAGTMAARDSQREQGTAPAGTPWMQLAPAPPMGWNSWNRFHCDVSESLIRETADALVSSGMRAAGYRYLVIDDCWQGVRDARGHIQPDPARFPSGMKALSDYVHARGLAFGLYSDAGSATCQKRPGSLGYEAVDAQQYATWGVDYLKYDWCNTNGVDPKIAYVTMRDALRAAGRPVVFSMCEWGLSQPQTWARGVAHLWRTTDDILECWDCTTDQGGLSWPKIVDLQAGLEKFSGPGGWNDPDMLQVGNPGMTVTEGRAHFSFWALLAAPLMAGNDVRSMTPEIASILMNREVIAIDQDPLGRQGRKVRDDGDREVWAKALADGSQAVILFNRGKEPAPIAVSWHEIGWPATARPAVRDLWAAKDLGRLAGPFVTTVGPHDVVLIRAMQ